MKKLLTTLTLLMTLLFGISNANSQNLSTPSSGKIIVGGEYGLFQQANIATQYAVLSNLGTVNPQGSAITVPTYFRSGYGFRIGYLFANDYDILLSNFIYYGRNNDTVSPGADQVVFMTAAPPPAGAANIAGTSFSVYDYKTELYQLNFGYYFHLMHDIFIIHPFLGVSLGKMRQTQQIQYGGVNNLNGSNTLISTVSSFNGVGPSAGVDLSWHVWRWFSLVGSGEWMGIIANLKQNMMASTTVVGFTFPFDIYTTSNPNVISILNFEAGLSTDFQIKQEDIAIELGYRAIDAINGSSNIMLGQNAAVITSDFLVNSFRDFSFQGPFIRICAGIST